MPGIQGDESQGFRAEMLRCARVSECGVYVPPEKDTSKRLWLS